jgi:hypothetical protein
MTLLNEDTRRKLRELNLDEMIEAIQEAYYLKALNPSDSSTLSWDGVN